MDGDGNKLDAGRSEDSNRKAMDMATDQSTESAKSCIPWERSGRLWMMPFRWVVTVVLALLAPWRITACKQASDWGRFWLVLFVCVVGVLLLPALLLGTTLAQIDVLPEPLPAPQAGLMASMGDGVIRSQPLRPANLALHLLLWLVAGMGAAMVAHGLLWYLLWLLGGPDHAANRAFRWSAYMVPHTLPLAVANGLWVHIGVEAALHQPVAPWPVAGAIVMSLWGAAGCFFPCYSVLKDTTIRSSRAALAVLGSVAIWPIAWLATQVAALPLALFRLV